MRRKGFSLWAKVKNLEPKWQAILTHIVNL